MSTDRRRPEEHLPLSVPIFQILLSLCEGAMHGYALLADIRSRTDTAVELGAGTLYAAIKRMVAAGMVVESRRPRGETDADSRRRYYRITKYGRQVAVAEAKRLRDLTVLAHMRHLISEVGPSDQ
jgi:DNA-binding PadR family transcriptional regulator